MNKCSLTLEQQKEVIDMYVNNDLFMWEIGEKFNISKLVISKILVRNNVKSKDRQRRRKKKRNDACDNEIKFCTSCKEQKPSVEFCNYRSITWCKSCVRTYHYKKSYNMSYDDYDKKLLEQNYRCAICNKHIKDSKKRFAVDHDHNTSKIRGLLCAKCNLGLGYFDDNIERLNNAVLYLKSY